MNLGQQILVATSAIPAGHKISLSDHLPRQPVIKFGWTIGQATSIILPGDHVHTHNLSSMITTSSPDALARGSEQQTLGVSNNGPCVPNAEYNQASISDQPLPEVAALNFQGYVRPNGRVGTRNYLAIISNVNCSASVARMIAKQFDEDSLREFPNVDGVISFRHESGCGMTWQGSRHRMLSRVLAAMTKHPNIGGCLMVGLGCEQGSLSHLVESEGLHQIHLPPRSQDGYPISSLAGNRPLPMLSIQESGGTRNTIQRGLAVVRELLPQVNAARRSTVPASHLILGTECGGSDGYSGITANPVLGAAADLLVAIGGTVVLSETSEVYGAEHLLAGRARNPSIAEKLYQRIAWWKEYCARYGELLDNNPSVGNKLGGLTTIAEKSLGAVVKGGSSTLEAVYEYAQDIDSHGLVFMDTPGFDPASVTGMVAGGANLIAFTTGRGSCFGFKPVPSFKIASNSDLFARLSDDMDFDAGPVIAGRNLREMGIELLRELVEVASGKKTRSELLGIGDEEFVPWLVGPVL